MQTARCWGGLKLGVGVFKCESIHAKIGIHTELKNALKNSPFSALLCVFHSQKQREFRLSLVTSGFDYDANKVTFSNPKRQSFILGHDKTATAQKALSNLIHAAQNAKTTANSTATAAANLQKPNLILADLEKAFSQEPVSKEFYTQIKEIFDEILLKASIPLDTQSKKEFSIKLLGRVLFVCFLQQLSFVPNEIFTPHKDYYQNTLAPLFFEVLNTPLDKRLEYISSNSLFANIPYLNGGLFSPSAIDCYHSSDLGGFSQVNIPDSIFEKLFSIFDQYHFTIDEQSSIDQEVSLDPEMLGQIFENLLAEIDPNLDESTNVRKATGSFYTPRNIVSFMCKNTIFRALESKLDKALHEKLNTLFTTNEVHFSDQEKKLVLQILNSLKILDLFCGSGAFPLGILHEIIILQELLNDQRSLYERKLDIIKNQIYGTDIQPIATEISRLRCFLSLIIETKIDKSKPNFGILPLPNLDFKFVSANSFIRLDLGEGRLDDDYTALISELKNIAKSYFQATNKNAKDQLKEQFFKKRDDISLNSWLTSQTARQILTLNPFDELNAALFFESELFFGESKFDICIGNPPYISTKGKIHQQNKSALLAQDGFFDDAYNHAFFSAFHAVAPNGIISFITPKTFWTISTKANLRKLILDNTLHFICDSANPFYSAMVDTCITQFAKRQPTQESMLHFIDATKNFDNPKVYEIHQSIYQNANAQVIFKPNAYNLEIYEKFDKPIKALMSRWWSKIDTSAKISKNHLDISHYRNSLKEGDLTLLGLITDGGQGLATANNGRFIAVRSGSKEATRTKEARVEKLFKAKQVWQDLGLNFANKKSAQEFLESKNENEIWQIFDNAKEKFGRDIFGQGFIYRITNDELIADIASLSDVEKANGINSPKCFVPYDKGDKDGNRWYLPTPYYIAWSKENVKHLQTDSRARWQGYNFFFKEGFCWILTNGTRSSNDLKFKISPSGVYDVSGMTLFSMSNLATTKYLICICNSQLINKYTEAFINFTLSFQMNDARQIPIIIPNPKQLAEFEALFDEAFAAQKAKFERGIDNTQTLKSLQVKLDDLVYQLYGLDSNIIKSIAD